MLFYSIFRFYNRFFCGCFLFGHAPKSGCLFLCFPCSFDVPRSFAMIFMLENFSQKRRHLLLKSCRYLLFCRVTVYRHSFRKQKQLPILSTLPDTRKRLLSAAVFLPWHGSKVCAVRNADVNTVWNFHLPFVCLTTGSAPRIERSSRGIRNVPAEHGKIIIL